jgi:hypothetical protein
MYIPDLYLFQLNGKEKPNYNSVDLSEVELQTDYLDVSIEENRNRIELTP